jgi:hypothetical protein
MSDMDDPSTPERLSTPDWWSQRFGSRGLLQFIIGTDTESLLLLTLSGGFVHVVTVQQNHDPLGSLVWLLGLVIVLYFLRNVVTSIISLVEAIRKC